MVGCGPGLKCLAAQSRQSVLYACKKSVTAAALGGYHNIHESGFSLFRQETNNRVPLYLVSEQGSEGPDTVHTLRVGKTPIKKEGCPADKKTEIITSGPPEFIDPWIQGEFTECHRAMKIEMALPSS